MEVTGKPCSGLIKLLLVAAFSAVLAPGVGAQGLVSDADSLSGNVYPKRPYSPPASRHFPTNVYWGDTHVHTSYSMDAGAFGARLGPVDAYRFAKGEEMLASSGQPVKLMRPLDFLVVADHSDNMGFFPRLVQGDPDMLADETGRRWYDMIQEGGQTAVQVAVEVIQRFSSNTFPPALTSLPGTDAYKSAWNDTIEAAENANAPGMFSAFIGYEWTSNTNGDNLHRVVIYRDDAEKAERMEPFTTIAPAGSDDPKDLWQWMTRYEEKTGGDLLAIAHNGNLSNGIMFPEIDSFTKRKLSKKYLQERTKWEPLYEATQIKGDGEAHPFLSPDDEFADFGTWDQGNLTLTVAKENHMLQYEYARSGLKTGLKLEAKTGINPYQFGMIGSTDSHTALATADSNNFFGKHTGSEPSPGRATHPMAQVGDKRYEGWDQVASGYAAVWARENTREAIFDAMMHKEVYATTGPRMLVRFFGGWDFVAEDANSRLPADAGYQKGVPMGGKLGSAPGGKSPSFLVAALRDPIGANLDRVQVVKGWHTKKGELMEKVYNVAWSDNRVPDARGKLPPVGNTVNIADASWANNIGAAELITVWEDPDFDPRQHAFYYARVLEIPTPNWTAYDAKYFKLDLPEQVPMVQQERAYTSPIWYSP